MLDTRLLAHSRLTSSQLSRDWEVGSQASSIAPAQKPVPQVLADWRIAVASVLVAYEVTSAAIPRRVEMPS